MKTREENKDSMWWEKEKNTQSPRSNRLHAPPPSKGGSGGFEDVQVRSTTQATPNFASEGRENPMTENTPKSSISSPAHTRQTLFGSSIILKGELSGDEDLTIEGQFEGTIDLKDSCLTIGPNGQVKADVSARQVIVGGKVTGKISARERVEIRKTGSVVGDLVTMGVAIEEGAYFKGSIEILREEERPPARAAASSWTA